jgi:hypothetical protein
MIESFKRWWNSDPGQRVVRTAKQAVGAAFGAVAVIVLGAVAAAGGSVSAVDWSVTADFAGGSALTAFLTIVAAKWMNRTPVEDA